MRHIKMGESSVMQEFERIATEKGWMSNKREADALPWSLPTSTPEQTPKAQQPSYDPNLKQEFDKYLTELGKDLSSPEVQKNYQNWFKIWTERQLVTPTEEQQPAARPSTQPTAQRQQSMNASPMVKDMQIALIQLVGVEPTKVGKAGPDGKFGPATAELWNEFVQSYPFLGLQLVDPKQPRVPSEDELRKVIGISKMNPQTRASTLAGPPVVERAKTSAIINELITLANDLDQMGELKVAEAVDSELKMFKAAADKYYDITGETGEQLIGEAHPGGGPTMAPAKEEGGKVETLVEQQKRDMKVVDSKPTGKYAAFVAKQLVALANRLDAEGKTEAALLVDKTLADLEGHNRPFVVKEATPIMAMMGPSAGFALSNPGGWLALVAAAVIGVGIYDINKRVKALRDINGNIDNLIDKLKSVPQERPGVSVIVNDFITKLEKDRNSLSTAQDNLPKKTQEVANQYARALLETTSDLSWFSDRLEELNKLLKGFWNWTRIQRLESALHMVAVSLSNVMEDEMVELEALKRSKSEQGQINTTPAPQAAKKEQEKTQTSKLSIEVQRLESTVKKILASFSSNQNGPNRNKLFQVLGGTERALKLKQGLEKMLSNITKINEVQAAKYNDFVWNKIYLPLQKQGLVSAASQKNTLIRQADDAPPELSGLFSNPAKVKKPGVKNITSRSREDIKQFQQVMSQIGGLPPGIPGKVDGIWGPRTKIAWETLRGWTQNKMPAQSPAANDPNGPTATEVTKAIRIAQWFVTHLQNGNNVPIAGVELPIWAFQDAVSFLRGLERIKKIQKDTSGHLDVSADRVIAAKILREFIDSSEDTPDLTMRFGEKVKELMQKAQELLSQFEQTPGMQSYRMPEDQANQAKGVGGLGTLEGPSGGAGASNPPGGANIGGKGGEKGKMPLKAQVYNIPDVSNFVNNPRHFAVWAGQYLKWIKKPVPADQWVAAHTVLNIMSEKIAELEVEVMKSSTEDQDGLLTILRQRHEALNDMYQTLPKG